MSVDAETLNVILAARDREFARAMESNTRRIERFAKGAQKDLGKTGLAFDKLATAAKAFASVAAIRQVATWVRDAADRLGDLKDAATSIGITTDALQELRYAAQLNGVSTETLQTSLEKMAKNLGDASIGGSAAKQSLDALGLSAEYLASLPLEVALGEIADKLITIENPMQRAALAADMFGKSGVDMINVLSDGSRGLQEMAAEANRLGVVINQDVIASAAEAGDRLDALSMIISANLTQALINVAPALIYAAQSIASISQAIQTFLSQDYSLPSLMNADDIRTASEEYNDLRSEFDALAAAKARVDAFDTMYDEGVTVDLNQEAAAVEALAAAEATLATAKENRAQKQEALKNFKGTMDAIVDESAALKEQIRLQDMSTDARIRETAAKEKSLFIDKAMSEAAIASGGVVSDEAAAGILELANAHEALYIQAELSKTAQTGSAGAARSSKESTNEAKDALAAYTLQIEELGLTFDEFTGIADSVKSSMEDAFMGIVDGTMSAKDAFRSMAVDIIKELYRVLVVQRLVGNFATATTAGSGILGAVGSAIGIKGNAAGGPVQAGQPVVTGEHGRELFVPSTSGRILSVPQTKAAVGGGGGNVTVMQTINVSTGVQQTVRAEIKSLMPQIADSAKAAVLDAKRRGGSYGSSF